MWTASVAFAVSSSVNVITCPSCSLLISYNRYARSFSCQECKSTVYIIIYYYNKDGGKIFVRLLERPSGPTLVNALAAIDALASFWNSLFLAEFFPSSAPKNFKRKNIDQIKCMVDFSS